MGKTMREARSIFETELYCDISAPITGQRQECALKMKLQPNCMSESNQVFNRDYCVALNVNEDTRLPLLWERILKSKSNNTNNGLTKTTNEVASKVYRSVILDGLRCMNP
uniref:Uncharacterized protein n=1 Tax=Glossina pallidipes TaxID=7398 RepID=A0A1B0A6Q9_GLOPL